ncbi:HNH endonuclease [Deinococcus sp. KSM4-11]|uniref:HNH endonuclease n=1 Tax=Deinococcus sp. KSM4-11 TaxID=2568654 RepID=UPI001454DD3B|nr:HNH endonuclease [Deinococcus sp. KSM4-11]
MTRIRLLIHRYDNEPDIRAVKERGYSDVFMRSKNDDFDFVAVVPTLKARTKTAVIADAIGGQYAPDGGEPWPGRPDKYRVRVDVTNVEYTTVNVIREAMEHAGISWAGQWTVRLVEVDFGRLFEDGQRLTPVAGQDGSLPGEIGKATAKTYVEGAVRSISVNSYERDRNARRDSLQEHGMVCKVCETDFVKQYGPAGEGIIHVHHVNPLSEIGKSYMVNPIKDLVPVCPNCHAVIHRRNPPFTIEEIRAMRETAKAATTPKASSTLSDD